MKPEFLDLKRALVRLPHEFDFHRLRDDVGRFPELEWSFHPEGLRGVRVLPLISVGGGRNSELAISGPLRETSELTRSPYLRQVLAAFEAPLSRTQLLWIEPNASVPPHRHSGYYWYRRVRIHVPILTNPAVTFECGTESVHMRAGESWGFDRWTNHSQTNGSETSCIHLVVDLKESADAPRA